MTTAFYWDERCFWHAGAHYAGTMPVGGFVQPLPDGLPDGPETKRRFLNLLHVSGLARELSLRGADPATDADLARVHAADYLARFRAVSDAGGGEIGLRTPFGPGGFEIAVQSAGLAKAAIMDVARGDVANAYALSRPPGHHCTADWANGFCLLNNIAIGVEAARGKGLANRVAILDWDVHHGNGTEAIFYDRADTLTISVHQERNYPVDTGEAADQGGPSAPRSNVNIPLPQGSGHATYLDAFDRIVAPRLRDFAPDLIVVACGFDAAAGDPLSHTLATADTFRQMTRRTMALADALCGGKLVLVHEGGYSEVYVPFCGHAVMEELSGSAIHVPDPLAATYAARQPGARFDAFARDWVDDLVATLVP
ncbi:class II histone deacetylase [Pseudaestuariivita atlantica]|uniref:Acetoin utilization protein n=1 Tax=Pseudaestuariivita atlantica TaxID=1317121 RepID=A0A0L1JQB9_9RHOB|nr:class II histone deacetylase [Pseudaestuariivita atlantica]KNG93618.1 acetoin utilization protein [Pseudaestuariivita atlantica]